MIEKIIIIELVEVVNMKKEIIELEPYIEDINRGEMTKQEKFENYMNNTLASWVLKMVVFANVFVGTIILLSVIK